MNLTKSTLLNKYSELTHAFTTKDGGVSKKPYLSLNLAFHVEDNIKNVEVNHTLLARELEYDKNSLVHMRQIHSDVVHIVEDSDNFDNPPTCDALITDRLNTPLMVMVADCSGILFYDDEKKVIAVAHVGRAGAFKNIVKNVIDSFLNDFGCSAENIIVSVGASIGVCCYEVGSEIFHEAQELGLEYAIEIRDERYYLDVSKIIKSQLLASGIKDKNIEISDECSCCNNNKYFSYRKEGLTGRFSGIIALK